MQSVDGDVKLSVSLNTSNVKQDSVQLAKAVNSIFESYGKGSDQANSKLMNLQHNMAKYSNQLNTIRTSQEELAKQQFETEAFKQLTAETQQAVDKTNELAREYQSLAAEQEKLQAAGGKLETETYAKLSRDLATQQAELQKAIANGDKISEGFLRQQISETKTSIGLLEAQGKAYEVDEAAVARMNELNSKTEEVAQNYYKARDNAEALKSTMQSMVQSGEAYTTGVDTKEYATAEEKATALENKLAELVVKYNDVKTASEQSMKGSNQSVDKLNGKLKKTNQELQNTKTAGTNAFANLDKTCKKGLFTILKYGFGIRSLYVLVRKLKAAAKEAFTAMAKQFPEVDKPISNMVNSINALKMSIGTMLQPLLPAVESIIVPIIDLFAKATTAIGMFFAALTGQGYIYKATKANKSYANSVAGAGSAAKKAKKELAEYDELLVINAQEDSGGGGGGAGGLANSFEKVPIEGLTDKYAGLLELIEKLKNAFSEGFELGFGDSLATIEDIKKRIGSIKDSLVDIFTDPGVLEAGENFALAVANSLGKIVGSAARIGINFADLFVGGIDEFLKDHKDSIKDDIIAMFNVNADTSTMFGDFALAIANISDVIKSDTAISGLASTFGIIYENVANSMLLFSKFGNSFVESVTTPIIDNQDRIKEAFQNTVDSISKIMKGIEDAVTDTWDSIQKVYDEHVAPFVTTITDNVSEIVGTLTDGYNTYIAPVLDKLSTKFEEVMSGKVGDALSKVSEAFGSFLDLVGTILDKLQPVFNWISQTVMPILATVLEFFGDQLVGGLEQWSIWIEASAEGVGKFFDALNELINGDIDFTEFLAKFQDIAENMWEGLIEGLEVGWETFKTTITDLFNNIVTAVCDLFGIHSPSTVFKEIGGYLIEGLKAGIVAAIDKFKSKITKAFDKITGWASDTWEDIKDVFSKVGSWFGDKFTEAKEKIEDAWNGVKTFFAEVWNNIKSTFNSVKTFFTTTFTNAWTAVKTAFANVSSFFTEKWNNIKSIFYNTASWFGSIFTNAWTSVKNAFSSVSTFFTDKWNNIKSAFSNTASWFSSTFTSAWNNVKNAFSVSTITSHFTSAKNAVVNAFSSVGNSLYNTFSDAWSRVKSVFSSGIGSSIESGVKATFTSVINSMIGGLNNVIKSVQNSINNLITKLKSAPVIGSFVKSKVSSISLPTIPKLAQGAVIPPNKEFLAMLGDQKHGTNIETPLDTMIEAFDTAFANKLEQLVEFMSSTDSGSKEPIVLQLPNGRVIAELVWDEEQKRYKQTGSPKPRYI